jgi:hydrogenase maturation factor
VSEFTANILVVGITAIGCVLLIIVVSPQILQSKLDIILRSEIGDHAASALEQTC